jgi:hypothetical protein
LTNKILILTPVAPDTQSASGRFVRHLLHLLGPEVAAVALITDRSGTVPEQFETLIKVVQPAPVLRRTDHRIPQLVEPIYWLFRQRMLKRLTALAIEITSFAARHHVSHMIAILDHPATIWLSHSISHSLGIRYSTFLSTVPECVLHDAGYDKWSSTQIYNKYVEVQKSSQVAGFATRAMANYYRDELSLNAAEICIPAAGVGANQVQIDVSQSQDKILVGTILNGRFISSTQALISIFQEIGWRLNGKPIALRAIGSASGLSFQFQGKPADIEILGGLTEEETIEALSECSFNFLPSCIKAQFTQAERLCLPDDFPAYIAAERPLLVQSPKSSLIENIVEEFSLGATFDNSDEKVLIQALSRLAQAEDNGAIKANFSRLRCELFLEKQFDVAIRRLLLSSHIENNSTF